MSAIGVLFFSFFVVLGQDPGPIPQVDPDVVMARAELAAAHNMTDATLFESMSSYAADIREKIIAFEGLSEVELEAILAAFDASVPGFIRDIQSAAAHGIADELSYVELLYPSTISTDRWDIISDNFEYQVTTIAVEQFKSIIHIGCTAQEFPSDGCLRLIRNLASALRQHGLD
jgi:hypothetical protein